MSYFRESRNLELSTIYFIETSLNADWTGITTVKSFTNAYKATLPVVSVGLSNTINNRKEIGSTSLYNDYIIYIDIFAKSDGQRIDLSDYLVDKMKDGWVYYTHSQTSGDPETLSRVADGRIFVHKFLSNYKLDLSEESVDLYDKFRHFISISVKKSV